MEKSEIIKIFIEKKILSDKSSLIRRPFNWMKHYDNEAMTIFDNFKINYRSDEEAWFCLCRNIELPICPICKKKKVKFTGITKNGACGYNTTCEDCSANCVKEKLEKFHISIKNKSDEEKRKSFLKRKNANLEKYGDENYTLFGSESFKMTLQKKYGNEHFSNHEHAKITNLERYGADCNFKLNDYVEHSKQVKLKKYGDENFNNREKCKQTCLERYGVEYIGQSMESQKKSLISKNKTILKLENEFNCTLISTLIKKYGQGFKKLKLEFLKIENHVFVKNEDIEKIIKYKNEGCHTNGYMSKLEKDVLKFVKSIYNGTIIENDTSIVSNNNYRTYELDIYLPDLKLAIDFNGVYWHSTIFKDNLYHQRKTECCRKCGINIIHVYEDLWNNENNYIKNIIEECINGTFKNVLYKDNKIIIGNNDYPIFGNYEIIEITSPIIHKVGNLEYYDSGKIKYRSIDNESEKN